MCPDLASLWEVSAENLTTPGIESFDRLFVVEVHLEMKSVVDSIARDGAAWVTWVGSRCVEVQRELG
jgi:hypothetical protein